MRRVDMAELCTRFAQALSALYGAELAADELAYYRQGDPLDSDAVAGGDSPDTRYNLDWMSGAIHAL